MNDILSTLEQEVEETQKKCQENPIYRLSPENKQKILEISKKIETQLSETGNNINLSISKKRQMPKALRPNSISLREKPSIYLKNIQRKLKIPFQNL